MKMNEPLPGATSTSLRALEDRAAFLARHIGTTDDDQAAMLAVLGYANRGELIDAIVPPTIRERAPVKIAPPVPEAEALSRLRAIAAQNKVLKSFIGQGYYGTHTPGVILRNILENPAWYTAYTPYQPEISQGRLEALLNFQTMVCDLTGMAIANASMLDEATAAAEAMTLALRVGKSGSKRFYVADDVFAQTLDVVRTRALPLGIDVVVGPAVDAAAAVATEGAFAVLLQYPGATGEVRDGRALADAVHANGGLVIVAADILALTLLVPPGEWGADVVVGSTQRFGVPMGYGGPHAGFFATRDAFKRSMPGRLVGVTVDANGNAAYRLALQTREQHIRREKATSNICTAQVLLAVIAGMYAVYHGPEGLTTIARRVHRMTAILKEGLERLGFTVPTQAFFDTITVTTGAKTADILAAGVAYGFNFRRVDERTLGISFDETNDARRHRPHLGHRQFRRRAVHRRRSRLRGDGRAAARPRPRDALPDPSGLPSPPLRDGNAALPAATRRSRPGARSLDDPARLLYDEAQCDVRDDPGDVARIRRAASLRARRPGGRLPPDDPRAREDDVRGHRLRRGVAAAQCRLAGRIRGPADDRCLPCEPRRAAPQRVPDSGIGARHQSGIGADGRHARRGRRMRRRRQRGHGRPRGEGGRPRKRSRGDHDHVSVHAWRVRGGHQAYLRNRARARRPGVR
jgi:glycine cleavage system pyridoxal-binding protein P